MNTPNYQSFRQFNKTPIESLASSRTSITEPMTERIFNSDSLQDQLVRELAKQKTLPVASSVFKFAQHGQCGASLSESTAGPRSGR